MPLPLAAMGIGAGIGAIGGLFKSGPKMDMTGRNTSSDAMNAYKNLVAQGPGAADVSTAFGASKDYAQMLNNTASSGLYDMSAGNRLAEQQFAGQRQSLAQSLQDQMAVANRAASAAGRSSNDPILRARLGAEAMRATASLNSQQNSAAMNLGRQATMDRLDLSGQRVNVLQGLAQQAFSGQQTLFNMGGALQQMDSGAAQYEQSRGGGIKGALTGAITGAGAGMQFAQGFANIDNANRLTDAVIAGPQTQALNGFKMGPNVSMESLVGAGARGIGQGAAQAAMNPYFNPANFAQMGPSPAAVTMGPVQHLPASSFPASGWKTGALEYGTPTSGWGMFDFLRPGNARR